VAGVGEWEASEAERIRAEAEQRVAARRAALEQELAADASRQEAEAAALRERVAQYEREMEAYHAQLAEINDPAAFAAAAKRMPPAPHLSAPPRPAAAPAPAVAAAEEPAAEPAHETAPVATATAVPEAADPAPVEPSTSATNGVAAASTEIHPAEEEVLTARLAELDETEAEAAAPTAEPATTEVVVKGLGSFGAITGFRQALSNVEGIEGVALSLGQTGEFVFRATHAAGFDVRGAIVSLEGDGARVEERAEGGLRVTLDRPR
jgi:hypothetical protein